MNANNTDAAIVASVDTAEDAIRKTLAAVVNQVGPGAHLRTDLEYVAGHIAGMIPTARAAAARAAAHRGNLDIAAEGREARATDEINKTANMIGNAHRTLDPTITVLEAELTVAALPQPTGQTRESAAAEATAFLAAHPDKAKALKQLAEDSDPNLRALAAGDWGTRMAAAYGMPTEVVLAARTAALAHEAKGAGARAGYARAALEFDTVRGALGGASALAHRVLGS